MPNAQSEVRRSEDDFWISSVEVAVIIQRKLQMQGIVNENNFSLFNKSSVINNNLKLLFHTE